MAEHRKSLAIRSTKRGSFNIHTDKLLKQLAIAEGQHPSVKPLEPADAPKPAPRQDLTTFSAEELAIARRGQARKKKEKEEAEKRKREAQK